MKKWPTRRLGASVRISLLLLAAFGSELASTAIAQGTTTTIAVTGDQAPGTPAGALFNSIGNAVLNSKGQTAYFAELATGAGGVDLSNNHGIWHSQTLFARQGSQAPGTPAGALFSNLSNNPALNDVGQVAYSASLLDGAGGVDSTNNVGIWRDTTLVARKGAHAPGTPVGALFHSFNSTVVLNALGQTAYGADLQSGGGVTPANDRGIWRDQTLIVREGAQAPGTPVGAVFNILGSAGLSNSGETVYHATLIGAAGGVDGSNNQGVWRDQTLFVREGTHAPGTPAGALFSSFSGLKLNDSGQAVYAARLQTGAGGVNSTNNSGIWRDQTLIARKGSQAPGTPAGAVFNILNSPVMNDAGQTAFYGTLQGGSGGVNSTNNHGVWRDQTLIAREGTQAPGAPAGALFRTFGNPSINDAGQTAYFADLMIGPGGVDSTNDRGIWITDVNGESQLVAREGGIVDGGTIHSLNFTSGDSFFGRQVFNNLGQLLFGAEFPNGEVGKFLFTPELDIDSDRDGDTDGRDFLVLQRFAPSSIPAWESQFGTSVAPLASSQAVPEPSTLVLLAAFAGMFVLSKRNKKR